MSLRSLDSDADSFHTADGEEVSGPGRRARYEVEEGRENGAVTMDELAGEAGAMGEEVAVDELAGEEGAMEEEGAVGEEVEEDVCVMEELTEEKVEEEEMEEMNMKEIEQVSFSEVVEREIEKDVERQVEGRTVKKCEDCGRWRSRVQELELQVEALQSALTAREMENMAMRSRAKTGGRTEAQLIQECESLRVTTEFLVCV